MPQEQNPQMYEDENARHDAMNSLASHFFMMYETEMQKVPDVELKLLQNKGAISYTDQQDVQRAQEYQNQLAQRNTHEGTRLANEMAQLGYHVSS